MSYALEMQMAETRPLGSVLYFYTLPNGRVSAINCVTSIEIFFLK
jgi:hypothetical protein